MLGRDYPFVRVAEDQAGLIADFYLSYEVEAVLPLKLHWVFGLAQYFFDEGTYPGDGDTPHFTPVHAVDLIVKDSAGTTIFDSRTAEYVSQAFGDLLRIHEWQTTDAVCRLVQHTAFEDTENVIDFPASIEPTFNTLDARTCDKVPPRLRSITVGLTQMSGNVRLVSGFNIEQTVGEPKVVGLLNTTSLAIAAVPGSGLGRYPGCEEPDVFIRNINGVKPDEHGRFKLAATGCYWVRQPQERVSGNLLRLTLATLQVGNDCGPCCVCDDYVKVYKALRRIWSRYRNIGFRAVATRDQLAANILRFEEAKACRKDRVLSVQALIHNTDYVEIQGTLCNAVNDCSTNVEMRLKVVPHHQVFPEALSASSEVLVSSSGGFEEVDLLAPVLQCEAILLSGDNGLEPSPIAVRGGAYVGFWDYLDPGQNATMRLRVRVPFVGPATSVTVTVSATVDGVAVPENPDFQTISVTAAFLPPECPMFVRANQRSRQAGIDRAEIGDVADRFLSQTRPQSR